MASEALLGQIASLPPLTPQILRCLVWENTQNINGFGNERLFRAKSRPFDREGTSSLGKLAKLPVEIHHQVIDNLDFASLLYFAMVNHKARKVVESHLTYQAMMRHAPDVLSAMAECGSLGVHPLSQLQVALYDERCVSCSRFGGLFFLPGGVRLCVVCQHHNWNWRMVSRSTIRLALCFPPGAINVLPGFRAIPGRRRPLMTPGIISGRHGHGAVLVRDVKKLDRHIFGSAAGTADDVRKSLPDPSGLRAKVHAAPSKPPGPSLG